MALVYDLDGRGNRATRVASAICLQRARLLLPAMSEWAGFWARGSCRTSKPRLRGTRACIAPTPKSGRFARSRTSAGDVIRARSTEISLSGSPLTLYATDETLLPLIQLGRADGRDRPHRQFAQATNALTSRTASAMSKISFSSNRCARDGSSIRALIFPEFEIQSSSALPSTWRHST
jgi:hypothetical protein